MALVSENQTLHSVERKILFVLSMCIPKFLSRLPIQHLRSTISVSYCLASVRDRALRKLKSFIQSVRLLLKLDVEWGFFFFFKKVFHVKSTHNTTSFEVYIKNKNKTKILWWRTEKVLDVNKYRGCHNPAASPKKSHLDAYAETMHFLFGQTLHHVPNKKYIIKQSITSSLNSILQMIFFSFCQKNA